MNDEILKRLDALAAKLGVSANVLWSALLRQSRVEAVTDTIFLFLLVGVVAVCIWVARKTISEDGFVSQWGDMDGTIFIISMIIVIFSLVSMVHLSLVAITEFFNPNYFAFQRIMSLVKQ